MDKKLVLGETRNQGSYAIIKNILLRINEACKKWALITINGDATCAKEMICGIVDVFLSENHKLQFTSDEANLDTLQLILD
ncbi:hypothetical protein JCM31739_18920 [Faecalimonas canis]